MNHRPLPIMGKGRLKKRHFAMVEGAEKGAELEYGEARTVRHHSMGVSAIGTRILKGT
jgi:hypothetical protein